MQSVDGHGGVLPGSDGGFDVGDGDINNIRRGESPERCCNSERNCGQDLHGGSVCDIHFTCGCDVGGSVWDRKMERSDGALLLCAQS